jgi:mutator protein MutT
MPEVLVMGAAVVHHGRLLAARRARPDALRGRWELPGGKVEGGEDPHQAVVREIREELGCVIRVTGALAGEQPIGPGLRLRAVTAELVAGDPVPREHDAVRWLAPEELDDVTWLEPDRPFLPELRSRLLDGEPLSGGNVGGAVRIGRTVRRPTGPWTPAVHRLLRHVKEAGLRCAPRTLGVDERGREVLDHLPGAVVDVDRELLSDAQLADLARWTRELHDAVAGFQDPGPWRFVEVPGAELVAHNDLAPYNVCFSGDRLSGVFDWDFAGPSTRVFELAQLAWTAVPLFRPLPAEEVARRLRLVADGYSGPTAQEILAAVPPLKRAVCDRLREQAAAGDESVRALLAVGEPERTERALAEWELRMPLVEKELR